MLGKIIGIVKFIFPIEFKSRGYVFTIGIGVSSRIFSIGISIRRA